MKNFKTEILLARIAPQRGFKRQIEFDRVLVCRATNNRQTKNLSLSIKVTGKSDRQIEDIIKNAKKALRGELK